MSSRQFFKLSPKRSLWIRCTITIHISIQQHQNKFLVLNKINISPTKSWFFRTYTVENSLSSLSVQQCSKVDKYQSNKNSKPYYTSFTSMSC
ncbi:unknown protein [Microcystis aeruginosa NIES-843]|uniref:Uncharacterized protein n=1 Tax=Microcystis aeruginosa (strain NIES-843 / IAM M-2473) TaxID=449447 RepID=B0JJS2_MICAN|nr:unknown protein [Microcystis aeruginosa NIES-843]